MYFYRYGINALEEKITLDQFKEIFGEEALDEVDEENFDSLHCVISPYNNEVYGKAMPLIESSFDKLKVSYKRDIEDI